MVTLDLMPGFCSARPRVGEDGVGERARLRVGVEHHAHEVRRELRLGPGELGA